MVAKGTRDSGARAKCLVPWRSHYDVKHVGALLLDMACIWISCSTCSVI